ncbi:8-oxo-dGTP pyrophosphatase MutT (NUDIX family) [Paenibacillus shirakamiensis]|uniref:8-oxo-dGTP pyrophosphatase MutT (NUDIX family) n=1 Tax=Paenibacillus shirakamiensis TaxID=1265935 RepID=A0ABS4JBK5_9BACL|nr:NUDIX hydrolase [Paenibacillus shirakamiensis]MBP1999100.1 8-oxo-dGTP pyrophosphatase MutT (NUDIX family) [Paenibacillus shirakamiensis]
MKKISVAAFITDGTQFLACHSTGNSFYDLPKGLQEHGESPIEVCLRETQEETGLILDIHELQDLSVFPYMKDKDLHVFRWLTPQLPELEKLECTSYFKHYHSHQMLPEVDGYKYVKYEETEKYMTKSMAGVINKLL